MSISSDVEIVISDAKPETKPQAAEFDPSSPIGRIVAEIDEFVKNQNLIYAIRVYRNHAYNGLKEAKDIVVDWSNQRKKIIATGKLHQNIND
jgi:ribosomal protein L7/L12